MRAAFLVGALLLFAACSDDDKARPAPSPSSSSAPASEPASTGNPSLRILVSNDDGVAAPGIDALVTALLAEPDVIVTVVAPAEN